MTGYLSIALSIFVIPMLAAIAIPNFVRAREVAMQNACINNLRQIQSAKEQWTIQHNKKAGDPIVEAEVNQLLPSQLVCPAGGSYTYGNPGFLTAAE